MYMSIVNCTYQRILFLESVWIVVFKITFVMLITGEMMLINVFMVKKVLTSGNVLNCLNAESFKKNRENQGILELKRRKKRGRHSAKNILHLFLYHLNYSMP